jgi:hypothetical protein
LYRLRIAVAVVELIGEVREVLIGDDKEEGDNEEDDDKEEEEEKTVDDDKEEDEEESIEDEEEEDANEEEEEEEGGSSTEGENTGCGRGIFDSSPPCSKYRKTSKEQTAGNTSGNFKSGLRRSTEV